MFDFFFKKKFFAPKLFKKTKKSFLTILRKNSFFYQKLGFLASPGGQKDTESDAIDTKKR